MKRHALSSRPWAAAAAAADSAQAEAAADGAIMGASDPYVALLQRAMLARLQSMGFARAEAREALEAAGRGLHSSTVRLNVSAFCGTGGALRGCLGGV